MGNATAYIAEMVYGRPSTLPDEDGNSDSESSDDESSDDEDDPPSWTPGHPDPPSWTAGHPDPPFWVGSFPPPKWNNLPRKTKFRTRRGTTNIYWSN